MTLIVNSNVWRFQSFGFISVSSFDVWVGLVVGTGLAAPLQSTKKAVEEKSEREVGAEKRAKDGKQSTFSKTNQPSN